MAATVTTLCYTLNKTKLLINTKLCSKLCQLTRIKSICPWPGLLLDSELLLDITQQLGLSRQHWEGGGECVWCLSHLLNLTWCGCIPFFLWRQFSLKVCSEYAFCCSFFNSRSEPNSWWWWQLNGWWWWWWWVRVWGWGCDCWLQGSVMAATSARGEPWPQSPSRPCHTRTTGPA